MIDSTTLPYWIIGIVIAIIIIALIIYFGLKRGKSKQVSFEKKEEPKELTQAERSGNYQAKSGFNFAAGGGGDKQPVVNERQSLTTTPAKNASGGSPSAAAGAGAAGMSAAAAATAQARELKTEQEASRPAETAAAEPEIVEGKQEPAAPAETVSTDDTPTAAPQPEPTPAPTPKPQPEGQPAPVEEASAEKTADTVQGKDAVVDNTEKVVAPADETETAAESGSPSVTDSPAAPGTSDSPEAPAAAAESAQPEAPAEQETLTTPATEDQPTAVEEVAGSQAPEVEDLPATTTLPTQDEIDESAAAAAHQVDAAEAARAQESPEPSGDTVTAEPEAHEVQTEDIAPAEGRLGRLRGRLSKSNNVIGQGVLGILSAGDLDEDAWEEIEDTLIMADLGASTTMKVVDSLREKIAARGVHNEDEARSMLRETLIEAGRPELDRSIKAMPYDNKPAVVLVVGVNGTGKTTTVGKLGRVLVSMGHSVMFGAADTFRAAAADQLEAWGRRVGASTVRGKEGADPASVAFDAVAKGTEDGVDVVLVDTAGRLHTSTGLMDQLGKVKRVVEKKAKVDEVLLVLDATVGQNGIIQARTFRDVVDITGVVLTKLDGTAKGGIVFQVQEELGVPVKLVGLGEGADDLAPFEVESFVDALLY